MIQDSDITIISDIHKVTQAEKNFKKNLKSEIGTFYSISAIRENHKAEWSYWRSWPNRFKLIYDSEHEFSYNKKYLIILIDDEKITTIEDTAHFHYSSIYEHNANRKRFKETLRVLVELVYQEVLKTIREGGYDTDMRSWRIKANFRD